MAVQEAQILKYFGTIFFFFAVSVVIFASSHVLALIRILLKPNNEWFCLRQASLFHDKSVIQTAVGFIFSPSVVLVILEAPLNAV